MPTFEDYLRYQPPPGFRDELIHGEIILSPSANRKDVDLCVTLFHLLSPIINSRYVVRLDTTHYLGEKEGPRPDVFVIRRDRWTVETYPEGSPELVIEVLSPSNDPGRMGTKRELYFSDPRCQEVWEVHLDTKTVLCYRPRGAVASVDISGSLYLPGDLASGHLKVSDIFAGVIT